VRFPCLLTESRHVDQAVGFEGAFDLSIHYFTNLTLLPDIRLQVRSRGAAQRN
jgi:hypothetical protein